jgi:hypothetical protein
VLVAGLLFLTSLVLKQILVDESGFSYVLLQCVFKVFEPVQVHQITGWLNPDRIPCQQLATHRQSAALVHMP